MTSAGSRSSLSLPLEWWQQGLEPQQQQQQQQKPGLPRPISPRHCYRRALATQPPPPSTPPPTTIGAANLLTPQQVNTHSHSRIAGLRMD